MLTSAFTLVSPNLPIGGFSYSQGLEAFVENGVITDATSFERYLKNNLLKVLKDSDLPLITRLYRAKSASEFSKWAEEVLALRTTKEFRLEEIDKGKALLRLIKSLELNVNEKYFDISPTYLGSFVLYAKAKDVDLITCLKSYAYSYLEGQCIAAIKLVPIGQTKAWQLIEKYSSTFATLIEKSFEIEDDEIGSGLVNLSILSVLHETQYSRIFRS